MKVRPARGIDLRPDADTKIFVYGSGRPASAATLGMRLTYHSVCKPVLLFSKPVYRFAM